MRAELLAEADRVVAALPPGRREAVREIVVDALGRGELPASGRAFIARATGSTFLADVLHEAIAEQARGGAPAIQQADAAGRITA
jgi:hypothetical protein